MVEPAFDPRLRSAAPRLHAMSMNTKSDASSSETSSQATRARGTSESHPDARHAIGADPETMRGGVNTRDGSEQPRNPRRGNDNGQNSPARYVPPNTHFSSQYPPGQPFPGHYNPSIPTQGQYPYMPGFDSAMAQNMQTYQYPAMYQSQSPENASQSFPVLYSSPPPTGSPQAMQQPPSPTPFGVMRYASPPLAPPYPYAPQGYQPAYAASPAYGYLQPGANYAQYSPSDVDHPTSWWVVQPPVSPQPYAGTPSPYRAPFPVGYPSSSNGSDSLPTRGTASPTNPFPIASSNSSRVANDTGPSSAASSVHPAAPLSPDTGPLHQTKPLIRRPYHPNPPSHRSEWVMWVGNVPTDATHDELWRFFNKSDGSTPPGVMSIFLISRSSCAFVNYENSENLNQAIGQFNGIPLRSSDPRCPRLVCRVRQKDDDLKAGVGGQRGMGMHMRWVKQQKGKDAEQASALTKEPPASPAVSDDGVPRRPAPQSSGSGSFGSTTSSVLTKYFPKRYFILKSLTQFDLDLSVQEGVWATQVHNEGILDQAYRTSKEVYLIFGVNKSGEFYGFAKMAGPVLQGEHRVSWASRADSGVSPVTGRQSIQNDTIPEEEAASGGRLYFPAEKRLVEESPQPLTTPEQRIIADSMQTRSAPVPPVPRVSQITPNYQSLRHTVDERPLKSAIIAAASKTDPPALETTDADEEFHLDEEAPLRAMKQPSDEDLHILEDHERENEHENENEKGKLHEKRPDEGRTFRPDGETWGESFRVEWMCTDRLPFFRTRHLRNPWNKDREVKVSRDGTELEPGVGQQLIEEWQKLAAGDGPKPVPTPASKTPGSVGAGKKRQNVPTPLRS